MPLELKHPHPRNDRIMFFDEVEWCGRKLYHVYFIDGECEHYINGRLVKGRSASGLAHYGFAYFDQEKKIAEMMVTSVLNPKNEYFGYTAERIRQQWDDNRNRGTYIHRQIELYLNGLPHDADSEEFRYFLNFEADYPDLEIWNTELNLFSKHLLIPGQADALYRNAQGEFEIYDWKVCKKIYITNMFCHCPRPGSVIQHITYPDGSRCSAFGNIPLTRHLHDCNYQHYTNQLNIYRWLLKRYYGITAVRLVMVALHYPNQTNYERYELEIREQYIEDLFMIRFNELYPNGKEDFERQWGKPSFAAPETRQ